MGELVDATRAREMTKEYLKEMINSKKWQEQLPTREQVLYIIYETIKEGNSTAIFGSRYDTGKYVRDHRKEFEDLGYVVSFSGLTTKGDVLVAWG